nr:MAG TPA: hypothetical protein [Caudoviricetes sp.]
MYTYPSFNVYLKCIFIPFIYEGFTGYSGYYPYLCIVDIL